MKRKNKRILTAVLIILGLFLIAFANNLLSIGNFSDGYKPYGESNFQITDLQFVKDTGTAEYYTSKYWDIIQDEKLPLSSGGRDSWQVHYDENKAGQRISGSDFNLKSATPSGGGADSQNPSHFTIWTSKEEFSQRDFKVNIVSEPSGNPSGLRYYYFMGYTSSKISLVGDSGKVDIYKREFPRAVGPHNLNLEIKPSFLTNDVEIFIDGVKEKTIQYLGNYKIEITAETQCGSNGQLSPSCGTYVTLNNPSYKSDLGCDILPGEQTYVRIYNEGKQVNVNDFDRFSKFCPQNQPLKIYKNSQTGSDNSILQNIVDGETFTVPQGQIWSIEYIGEKGTFQTACESGEIFLANQNECYTRSLITFECPEGSFDAEKGICVVETEAYPYVPTSIATHKSLEQDSQFRATQTQDLSLNFNILNSRFTSNGVSYLVQPSSSERLDENPSNWQTSFNYAGQSYNAKLGEKIQLDDYLSVEVSDMNAFYSKRKGSVTQFHVDYTFKLNTEFLNISLEGNKLIVTNTYQATPGGVVVTKTDNLDSTTIDTLDRLLGVGQTTINIDLSNIKIVKARPFVTIETSGYKYNLDAKFALNTNEIERFNFKLGNIDVSLSYGQLIGGIVLLIILIGLLIWRFKK